MPRKLYSPTIAGLELIYEKTGMDWDIKDLFEFKAVLGNRGESLVAAETTRSGERIIIPRSLVHSRYFVRARERR